MTTTKPKGHMILDILGLIGSRAMLVVFGLGTGIITARLLGPHDRGLFALLLLLPQTLVTLAKMGVAQANVYYIRKRGVAVSTVASNALVMVCVLSVMVLVVCVAGREWLITPFTRTPSPPTSCWRSPRCCSVLIESYLSILQAVENFRAYNVQSIYKAVLSFAAIAFAMLVLGGRLGGADLADAGDGGCKPWLLYQVRQVAPFGFRWDARSVAARSSSAPSRICKRSPRTSLPHRHHLIAYFLTPVEVAFTRSRST
jgi:hypothetical protein